MAGKYAEMSKLICVQCGANDSFLWRNANNGQICNKCLLANPNGEAKCDTDDKKEDRDGVEAKAEKKRKKSGRHKAKTAADSAEAKSDSNDEGGNRNVFERPVTAPTAAPTFITSDYIFFRGNYMQAGDVVSITDVEGGTYYAQIRSFITGPYFEQNALITWLFPTRDSPHPYLGFDPATYMIGPDEGAPRRLEYMQFVMHLPTDYYQNRNALFPLTDAEIDRGYG